MNTYKITLHPTEDTPQTLVSFAQFDKGSIEANLHSLHARLQKVKFSMDNYDVEYIESKEDVPKDREDTRFHLGCLFCSCSHNYLFLGFDAKEMHVAYYRRYIGNTHEYEIHGSHCYFLHPRINIYHAGTALLGRYAALLPIGGENSFAAHIGKSAWIVSKLQKVRDLAELAYTLPSPVVEDMIQKELDLPFKSMQHLKPTGSHVAIVPTYLSWCLESRDEVPARVTLIYRYLVNNNGKKNSRHRKVGWEVVVTPIEQMPQIN